MCPHSIFSSSSTTKRRSPFETEERSDSHLDHRSLLSCIYPIIPCSPRILFIYFAWCIGHVFAKAVAPDIKQWSYFLSPKKKGEKRCLKSLQLKSYKSALAVVLQHNLCKAMALLSLNRFTVVGWFSDEEQLSSIRHVFLSEPSPPPHHTCPALVGSFW